MASDAEGGGDINRFTARFTSVSPDCIDGEASSANVDSDESPPLSRSDRKQLTAMPLRVRLHAGQGVHPSSVPGSRWRANVTARVTVANAAAAEAVERVRVLTVTRPGTLNATLFHR